MFTTKNAFYGSLENGFITICNEVKGYKYLAFQTDSIDYPSDHFQHISCIVLIARSVLRSSELWLCGDAKQNNTVYYDEYCKNVLPMNNSFQYNSPYYQKYNRYNDDCHSSFNTK